MDGFTMLETMSLDYHKGKKPWTWDPTTYSVPKGSWAAMYDSA